MKISVITVCYNSEATVAGTIESFLAQSHPDKEMLIVDGASTDGTVAIAQSYNSPLIKIISGPDRGAYDAMNKGLEIFGGAAVGVLNSDDTFHDEHALARISEALEDADIVYGDLRLVADHDSKSVVRIWRAGSYNRFSYYLGWTPPHPTFYVRRRVVDKVGRFDLTYRIGSDYDFMLRAMVLNDFRVRYIPQMLADFKVGGISTKDWRATLQGNFECLRIRRKQLNASFVDPAFFLRFLRRAIQLRPLRRFRAVHR